MFTALCVFIIKGSFVVLKKTKLRQIHHFDRDNILKKSIEFSRTTDFYGLIDRFADNVIESSKTE